MAEVELARPVVPANGGVPSSEGQVATVIASQDAFEGRLTLRGNGEVLGRFEGHIDSAGELLI
ncbi:MAG: hypothetical protein ACREPA_11825, partial [Candidatus Dormibacteraceae bacterium]